MINDRNFLEVPDSFSDSTRGFQFSGRPDIVIGGVGKFDVAEFG